MDEPSVIASNRSTIGKECLADRVRQWMSTEACMARTPYIPRAEKRNLDEIPSETLFSIDSEALCNGLGRRKWLRSPRDSTAPGNVDLYADSQERTSPATLSVYVVAILIIVGCHGSNLPKGKHPRRLSSRSLS